MSDNRVLVGKNVNSNHGHSTSNPGFGIYISRDGKNVLSCTADELIMNTDNGQGSNIGRVLGMLQAPAIPQVGGGTATSVSTTVNANTTATISVSNINFGLDLGFFGFGAIAPSISTANTTNSNINFSTSTSLSTISIENPSANNLAVKTFIMPRYSNLAFF